MVVGKVVGNAESSVRVSGLEGRKLMVVQRLSAQGKPAGEYLLATDYIGAGVGQYVAMVTGSVASRLEGSRDVPTDTSIVAIIDHLYVNDKEMLPKE